MAPALNLKSPKKSNVPRIPKQIMVEQVTLYSLDHVKSILKLKDTAFNNLISQGRLKTVEIDSIPYISRYQVIKYLQGS